MIRRGERPTSHYMVVANSLATDRSLSFAASGLLLHLLSKPDHWEVSVSALANEAKEGRDKIYSLIKELIESGYARRVPIRNEKGQMAGNDYEIHDQPHQWEDQLPENPFTDNPLPENPLLDNPTQESKEDKKITTGENNQLIDPAFDRFWNAGLPKVGKQTARNKFEILAKRSSETPDQLADLLADDIKLRLAAGQFGFDKLHPTTYLNQRRWQDDKPNPAPTAQIVAAYHKHLPANAPVTAWSDRRTQFVEWHWKNTAKGDVSWFDRYFMHAASQQGVFGSIWADFEWLMNPDNFPRVAENARSAAA